MAITKSLISVIHFEQRATFRLTSRLIKMVGGCPFNKGCGMQPTPVVMLLNKADCLVLNYFFWLPLATAAWDLKVSQLPTSTQAVAQYRGDYDQTISSGCSLMKCTSTSTRSHFLRETHMSVPRCARCSFRVNWLLTAVRGKVLRCLPAHLSFY